MRMRLFLSAVAGLTAIGGFAHAEPHAVGVKAGVLGLGVEYGYAVSDRLTVRVGLNGSEYGFDAEESGIDYDFDFVWDSKSIALDVHPMRGAFRVTGGLLFNDNRLDAVGRSDDEVTIGDTVYSVDQIGQLHGRVEFDDRAPFLGVGWDWSRGRRFGVSFDLGVARQGTPRVSLAATGPIAALPQFADDIEQERRELQEELDDFKVLPYATLGLVVRF